MVSRKEIYQLLAEKKISKDEAKRMLEECNRKQENVSFPMSAGQREIYFVHMKNPNETAYNVPVAFYCQDNMDEQNLLKALQMTVKKHELLRAIVEERENQIYLKILNDVDADFQVINKTGCTKEEAIKILEEKAAEPFVLEQEIMMRAYLVHYGEQKKMVMFVFHHIIFDGISLTVFLKDFIHFYQNVGNSKAALQDSQKQMASYKEFVDWQTKRFESPLMQSDKEFWVNQLSGELHPLEIYTGLNGQNAASAEGKSASIGIGHELIEKLSNLSVQNNVNMFHTMMSAYYVLLYRLSGNNDIIIGTPTMIRPNSSLQETIGYFINTIPLREKLNDNMKFMDLVKEFKNNMLEVLDHIYYPYSYIMRAVAEQGKSAVPGVFDVTFHYQSWMDDVRSNGNEANKTMLKLVPNIHQEGEFPLSLEIYQVSDDDMQLIIKYDTSKYTDAQAGKMLECYLEILKDIVEEPLKEISSINLVSEQDRKTQLVDWNNTKWEYPDDKRICDIFEEKAGECPYNTAIYTGDKRISYKELQTFSNHLAFHFYNRGIRKQDYVLIKMLPSYQMVAAILAIMKCGAAYVPLDPDIPAERMEFIQKDTNSHFLICDSNAVQENSGNDTAINVIGVDEYIKEEGDFDLFRYEYNMFDVAYVIYTSGSTGKPKGVEVMHKGLTNVIYGMDKVHHFTEDNSILMLTTLCFDIATVELYLPLIKGGSMVIAPNNIKKDGIRLKEFLNRHKVDYIQATPATWKMLMLVGWKDKQVTAITAGEALSHSLAEKMLAACKEVWNQYGPTENTVYSTVEKVEQADYITIGCPVSNTQAYILDKNRNIVPTGFAGELYVGGNCLAKGYLNREDLNETSFIISPFHQTERLYKTGDLVRYMENGDIDYLGRIDKQVKIRGFRIEIGEIECSIMKDENISQCAVVIKTDSMDNKMIVAYITVKNRNRTISVDARKKQLSNWLPSYMIPATFVELEAFPVTLSGKIDRKTLEHRDDDVLVSKETTQDGVVEKRIVSIVAKMIGKGEDKVDVNRNLSEYGFDSILFTALSAKVNETLQIEITPVIFYEHLTIKDISEYLLNEFETLALSNSEINEKKEDSEDTEQTGGKQGKQVKQEKQAIAIVGMSAKMPMSENAEEFWDHLINAHNMVSEIPIERWDYHLIYGPEKESKSKWGSFLSDIDLFDNEFFGISPREAAYMDPQQRLMLEQTWKCIEDAGYKMSSLAQKKVAVLIGASSNDYAETCREETAYIDPYLATGISSTIISNRISHIYNLVGPSITIDTACSSSLVALDLAVMEMQNGNCDSAIVGGVNILLNPYTYIALSKNGMLSPDGRCKVFDADANGYVRGEGAVAFYLKPLKQAEQDGDHIYAVIKGTAQNHCGKTSTLTTPSQKSQAELISEALTRAKLTPEDISYFEMHGTGTSLGDPIEVEGLKKVFGQYYFEQDKESSDRKTCGIGSVKSNIGHLEGAAGMAGLLKVVLSLQHKELAPNVNYRNLNPNILLNNTPLYIVEKAKKWEPVQTGQPLRAGVSAFGFGGANAHVVLEEYIPKKQESENDFIMFSNTEEQLFVFSAQSEYSLEQYAKTFLGWINNHKNADANAVAYQLQNGREEMKFRFAIVACGMFELRTCLQNYVDGKYSSLIYTKQGEKETETETIQLENMYQERSLSELAKYWVNGNVVDWNRLWQKKYNRLSLPVYCMQRLSYWVVHKTDNDNSNNVIDENISTFRAQRYVKHLTGKEKYLEDHIIAKQKILPGVVYLEMACEAARRSNEQESVKVIQDVTWGQPIVYQGLEQNVYIDLEQEDDGVQYNVYGRENEVKQICSQGKIYFEISEELEEEEPLEAIQNRCPDVTTGEEIYHYFEENLVEYGPMYHSIEKMYSGDQEAVSYISLPEARRMKGKHITLNPSLIDGALQTIIGIRFDKSRGTEAFYPYSIGKLTIYEELGQQIICHAKAKQIQDMFMIFDLTIWNMNGDISIKITDYIIRNRSQAEGKANTIEPNDNIEQMQKMLREGLLSEEDVMMLMEVADQ